LFNLSRGVSLLEERAVGQGGGYMNLSPTFYK
jgi:hypothetical protein